MVQELNFQPGYNDRLPPQNIDAEEAILGGILLDPEAIGRVMEILRPEAFYISAHREIYQAALTLQTQGRPTDLMSVTSWLQDHGLLDKVGGQGRLAELIDRTISAVNIDQYAQLVMEKYLRRRLIQTGTEVAQMGYDTTSPLERLLDQAEQRIFNVTQVRPAQGLTATADILTQTFSDIEQRHLGLVTPGIPCGFYDLDAITQGFQRSDLIITAGRPSMGKCLAADSELLLPDGSITTIAELYRARRGAVLTLGSQGQFYFTAPSHFVDDGLKPVFQVTTGLGRSVTTTLTHPFLTPQGWRSLADLRVGDRIAVPRRLAVFGMVQVTAAELAQQVAAIDPMNPEARIPELIFRLNRNQLRDWLRAILRNENATDRDLTSANSNQNSNQAINQTRDQTSHRNFQGIANWTIAPNRFHPLSVIELLTTNSPVLARQLHHLLLRFGIVAHLQTNSRGAVSHWQLTVTDSRSRQLLQSEFLANEPVPLPVLPSEPLSIRPAALSLTRSTSTVMLASVYTLAPEVSSQTWRSTTNQPPIAMLAPAPEPLPLLQWEERSDGGEELGTELYWDEITVIEARGVQPVYDLTIPETHNFVANDICVHNTSFVLNIARNIAAFQKLPVAVFSLEMSKEQLVYRLLASEARIESGRLRSGRISPHEWEALGSGIDFLSRLPVFIDDTPNIGITEMRSKTRRLQAENGGVIGLVLIDYLQLMEGGGTDNRVQELSKITRSLKGLARELSVPVIALSQLSRGVESRTNKRPMMSDLRESGSIEQDADLIMMLYREEYYDPDTPDRGIAEIIVAKHRNGPTGTVKMLFDPQFTQFRNLAAQG